VLSEDIGDFQLMLAQRCRWSFDFATGWRVSASSGLSTE
jgi:hypothetical protein